MEKQRENMIDIQRKINAHGSMGALCMFSVEALRKNMDGRMNQGSNMSRPSLILIDYEFIKEDFDRTCYIDYIHYIMDKQSFDSKRMHKILVEQGICKELKKSYDPKNTPKINIRQKYGWTMSLLSRNKIDIF